MPRLAGAKEENNYVFVGEAYGDGVMDMEIRLTEEKRGFSLV